MPVTRCPSRRPPMPCVATSYAGPFSTLTRAFFSCVASVAMLLLLSSDPAYAEWMKVSEIKQEGSTVYVDPSTVRRNGNLVKMWTLVDYKTLQTSGDRSYLSQQAQSEYDCVDERIRMLAFGSYSGNMASGKQVFSTMFDSPETSKWVPVSPDGLARTLWALACMKK